MTPLRFLLLEASWGGVHAITSTGSSVIALQNALGDLYCDLEESAWVLDKASLLASHPDPLTLCLQSPMPEPSLPAGSRCRFAQRLDGFDMPLCLDLVALDVYAEFWRSHGVRIARRSGSRILWEDGSVERIPYVC